MHIGTACLLVPCLPTLAPAQSIRFHEVGDRSGLEIVRYPGEPSGCAITDIDGDGWQDIVFFGTDDPRPRAFLNNGAALAQGASLPWFSEMSATIFPASSPPTDIGAAADLDNDGDPDLIVARRFPSHQEPQGDREFTGLIAYENVGGTYQLAATQPGLARAPYQTGGMALGDVDQDGRLDILFLQNYLGAPRPDYTGRTGWLIANRGFPNLVDETYQVQGDLAQRRRYFSCLLIDFNGDNLIDYHAAIDVGNDVHGENIGGRFREVAERRNVHNFGTDMGLSYGDIDNDGDPDFYATNINSHLLYVNDGSGTFTREGPQRGVTNFGTTGWGTAFADLDHDGDQDLLYVAIGQPGAIFENDGRGYFTRLGSSTGIVLDAFSLVPFDYDRDGDLDLLLGRPSSTPKLYENVSPPNEVRHWLQVELEGTCSNRDGVGAHVELATSDHRQHRWLVNGYSFKCNPPVEAHFGLHHATQADLRITWPSGRTSLLANVSADQRIHVVEPQY